MKLQVGEGVPRVVNEASKAGSVARGIRVFPIKSAKQLLGALV